MAGGRRWRGGRSRGKEQGVDKNILPAAHELLSVAGPSVGSAHISPREPHQHVATPVPHVADSDVGLKAEWSARRGWL